MTHVSVLRVCGPIASVSPPFVPSVPEVITVLREANKTYNVMRFSKALNVDVKTWTRNSVRLERESSLRSDVKVADGEAESVSRG